LTHRQLRAKALANADVKAEYEKLADEFSLLDEFVKARAAQGLKQVQLAEKIGTTQYIVARMESASDKNSPSLVTLTKYADALGCKLEVRLVRRPRPARNSTVQPKKNDTAQTRCGLSPNLNADVQPLGVKRQNRPRLCLIVRYLF
jgi:transcriptional regulator with XRE-family HTH domain